MLQLFHLLAEFSCPSSQLLAAAQLHLLTQFVWVVAGVLLHVLIHVLLLLLHLHLSQLLAEAQLHLLVWVVAGVPA